MAQARIRAVRSARIQGAAGVANRRVNAAPRSSTHSDQREGLVMADKATENPIAEARQIMQDALEDDGLRETYVANVACVLMDRLNIMDKNKRNEVADAILHVLFT